MKRKLFANGGRHDEEKHSNGALENQSSVGFKPGDVTWVKSSGGDSWWPAQVVDENTVCSCLKPRKKRSNEVLVRLYGTYEYSYVDLNTSLVDFDDVLKRHNGSHKEIIREALKQGFSTDVQSVQGNSDVDEDVKQSDTGHDVTPQKVGESARRLKVMQGLGLIAPSGSPFLKNGHTLTVVQ